MRAAVLLLLLPVLDTGPAPFEVFWKAVEEGRRFEEHPIGDLQKSLPPEVLAVLERNPYFKPDPSKKVRGKPSTKKEGFQVWFDEGRSLFVLVASRPTNKTVEIFDLAERAAGTIRRFDEDLGRALGAERRSAETWRARIFVQVDGRRHEAMVDALFQKGEITPTQSQAMKDTTSYYDSSRASIYVAPGLEESRIDHEVIHMLAHLLASDVAGPLPYWLQEALAWDLENRVLGYVRSYCQRAGFVSSRGKGWERATISEVPIGRFLGLTENPTDKDIIGLIRLVRRLMEDRDGFLQLLQGFRAAPILPARVELLVPDLGPFTITEIPEEPPYRLRVQKLLLLRSFGDLPKEGPQSPEGLLAKVRAAGEARWLSLFQEAVDRHPRKDIILGAGRLLAPPGSEKKLPIKELMELAPARVDVEAELAAVDSPFEAWAKATEKALLRR